MRRYDILNTLPFLKLAQEGGGVLKEILITLLVSVIAGVIAECFGWWLDSRNKR